MDIEIDDSKKYDAKKFIAIFGDDMGDGTSSFYIVDEEYYKEEGCENDDVDYLPEVYDCIEQLGHGCSLDSENFFTVEGIKNEAGLRKFLKPLKWIVVESDYLNGAEIQEFNDTPKNFAQEMKKLDSKNIVLTNEIGDDYLQQFFFKLTKADKWFSENEIKSGLSWAKKELAVGKFVVISPDSTNFVYTFKNKDEFLQIVKKAQEIRSKFISDKEPPENAPLSVKLAIEKKIPYLISNSKKELDDWENLATNNYLTVIRGEGLILAFPNITASREFSEKLLKIKAGNQKEIIKKNAKKLNIPFYNCKNKEDFYNIRQKFVRNGEIRILKIYDSYFVFKNDDEMKKLSDFSLLDESNDDYENEDENYQ